ncbi:MAG: DUF4384 domain-containing protein [Pseudomonadota bacterium]
MTSLRKRLRHAGAFLCAGTLALACAHAAAAEPRRVALLVGVGAYDKLARDKWLEGPPHDVAALREVLVRRWGYKAQDIKTLVDGQASRANILAELAALGRRSGAGDEVLVYFSGHGTSALAANSGLPVPFGSGAFIPADFDPAAARGAAGLIIGSTDLVPAISALEAGGRRIWGISDSCYAGQQFRSLQLVDVKQLPSRMISMSVGADARAQRADLELARNAPPLPPYPYRATAYLSSSSEGERAKDIPSSMLGDMPTIDGKPHGAMTDALLRVLEGKLQADLNNDGLLSLDEVHRATSDFMASRAYGHSPQRLPAVAEDQHGLGARAVLGARGMAASAHVPERAPLRVHLTGVPELNRALSGLPGIAIAAGVGQADLIVRLENQRLRVITPGGDLLAAMPPADSARAVAVVRQLAWAQDMRRAAEQHRRAVLAAELTPAAFGGNFVIGSKVSFVVRPDRAATLVLLNIDADGKVSVLYPYRRSETAPLAAGQARQLPGTSPSDLIEVREPVGMDLQFIFAFDAPPPGLDQLVGMQGADPGDPRLQAFTRSLAAMNGKFSFASTSMRALKP